MGSFADGFEKKIRREVEQELKVYYDRKLAEIRQQTEESKKEAEANRKQVEENKKQAEENKKQAEESKKQAEESKKQAEESRQQAEASKKEAEASRKQVEENKREAEENRRQFIAILVRSLSSHTDSFDQMYKEVTSNNIFADVTREELKQIMNSTGKA